MVNIDYEVGSHWTPVGRMTVKEKLRCPEPANILRLVVEITSGAIALHHLNEANLYVVGQSQRPVKVSDKQSVVRVNDECVTLTDVFLNSLRKTVISLTLCYSFI